MKTTKYLYNIDPKELMGMEYFTALQFKYDSCTKLFKELFLKHDRTHDEDVRLYHVGRAQGFTKRLIKEKYDEF